MNKELIDNFINNYKPGDNLKKPVDEEFLKNSKLVLPPEIIYLWEEYGFGEYGNGIIKVVDPRDYMHSLYTWLGKEDLTKIPIMVSAFGDIFYFRKITEEENDISLLNIHYRRIDVCSYSYQEFFNSYINSPRVKETVLREKLYNEALNKLGKLEFNEIFMFAPALAIGGAEDIKYVAKGDANTHQMILFDLGR